MPTDERPRIELPAQALRRRECGEGKHGPGDPPTGRVARGVLLVGDHAHRDFREVVSWLGRNAQLVLADTFADGWKTLRSVSEANGDSSLSRFHPDVIVLAQSRPGQIHPREVEELHAAWPLARLVVLAGSWCEGELRTGRPASGVIRVLWHQWQPRLIPFLQPGAASVPGTWQLPRTASQDERLASTVGSCWPRGEGLVAIHTESHESFSALSDACQAGGYATVGYQAENAVAASGVVAALADGIACDAVGVRFLQRVVQRHRPAPVIALLDFVRRQDFDLAKSVGVAAVLAKPLLVYDLLWHLDNSLAGSVNS